MTRSTGSPHRIATTPYDVAEVGPRPRLLQLGFASLMLVSLVARAVATDTRPTAGPVAGMALVLAVAVHEFVLDPPLTIRGSTPLVLVGLDLVGVTLAGLSPSPDPLLVCLALMPTLWLGVRYGSAGAWMAGVGVLLTVEVPVALGHGLSDVMLVDRLVLPAAAGLVTFAAGLVTAWALAARELAEQRARALAIVLDTVDVGVIALDTSAQVVMENPLNRRYRERGHPQGYSGLEERPHDMYAIDGSPLPHGRRPTVLAATGHEFDDHRIWVGSDPATRVALSVSARTVRGNDGRQVGAVMATRDITSLVRALRTRDTFVASVSHELRTPLTSMLGYLHLLGQRDDLSASAHDDLDAVRRNADRLAVLVGDLVHTAQADGATSGVNPVDVELTALVEEAVTRARPRAAAAHVSLRLVAPSPVGAHVDQAQALLLLETLVGRATARSPRGSVVDIEVTVEDARAEIRVVDDGTVLDARAREHDLRDHGPIGLARAKTVAEAHGGRLEIDCDVPRGCAVRVRLPVRRAVPAPVPVAVPAPVPVAVPALG